MIRLQKKWRFVEGTVGQCVDKERTDFRETVVGFPRDV